MFVNLIFTLLMFKSIHVISIIIMACRAIPMIAFPWVRCMFIYNIYMYILYVRGHLRDHVLYMYM